MTRPTRLELWTIFLLVSPYVLVTTFIRTINNFLYILIFGVNAILILFFLVMLYQKRDKIKFEFKNYLLISIGNLILFVSLYGQLLNLSNYIFYQRKKSQLKEFVARHNTSLDKTQVDNIQLDGFISIEKEDNEIIVFTISGMLDNCEGIIYSKKNINPGHTNCGRIVEWQRLEDNWYFWYST